MEEKKRRKPANPFPDIDVSGPAAWGESRQDPRRTTRGTRRVRQSKEPENGGKKKAGAPRVPKVKGRQKRSFFLRFIIWAFWTGLGLGLAGLVVLFFAYSYLDQDLPSTDGLKNYAPPTVTYFYSDDGRVIGEYSHERRFVVPISEIPPMVRNAFIAVEDAEFYKHRGINPKAIIRAAIVNFQSDSIAQGGSTITQQVIKIFLLSSEKSYIRKFKEMILAFRIEKNLSKDDILYLYLNHIYLGAGAYGVESAARTYFDKSAQELTIAEAAQLAGIVREPNKGNPINNPEQGRRRRITALDRMLEEGFITRQQYEEAKAEPLRLQTRLPNPSKTVTPYFTEHVRRLMEEKVGEKSLYNDGWKVYTTVNIEAQRDADAAVARGLWEYSRRRGYRGPVEQLASEADINNFLRDSAEEMAEYGLMPDHLYKAVITEVDLKNSALKVQIGAYQGHIAIKNSTWAVKNKERMAWALKKGDIPEKRFQRGDVIWVRLLAGENVKAEGQTTADQSAVVGRLTDTVLEMSLEQRLDTQSALLSMDLSNGDVKAMVGGRDSRESQFNRATQSQRQPGSSFKPILYASAMDHGYTPGSIMNDAPFVVDDPGSGKRWKPVNSDLKFKGPMSLYTALVGSRNLISIKLLDRIGFEALAETARNLGITEKLPESLTIALGAHGLHMPELLSAYSAFPNMGERVVPRYITRIEDRYGNVVETFEPQRIPSLDPGSACAVTWMLRGVVEHGTGTVVKPLGRPVGGKTGTTNDYSDAWFVGFTPELVTAVWVGTDRQRPRAVGEVGGKAAGPMFLYYMQEVLKGKEIIDFVVPPEAEVVHEGGPFGICYKAGTVGTGLSEAIPTSNDDILKGLASDDPEPLDGQPYQGSAPVYDGIDRGDYDRGQGYRPSPEANTGGYRPPAPDNAGAPPESFIPRPQQPPAARPAPAPAPTPPAPRQEAAQPYEEPPRPPAQEPLPPPQPLAQPSVTPSYGSQGAQSGRGSDGRLSPYGSTTPSGSDRLPTYGEEEARPVFDEEVFERDSYFRSGN